MGKDFRVILNKESERAENFMRVFGRLEVCVTSPIPSLANLPRFDDPQLVYMLDLEELTEDERGRLLGDLHRRFNIPFANVRELVAEHGVPILASECTLMVDIPLRLWSCVYPYLDSKYLGRDDEEAFGWDK